MSSHPAPPPAPSTRPHLAHRTRERTQASCTPHTSKSQLWEAPHAETQEDLGGKGGSWHR